MDKRFTALSTEIQELVHKKLRLFNQGRIMDKWRYYILTPTEKSLYYSLWFHHPEAEHHRNIYLSNLELSSIGSVNRAIRILSNSLYPLEIVEEIELLVNNGDDIILFGKYRGRHLQHIYQLDPKYILWIADKYIPKSKNESRFKALAISYGKAYLDLHTPKKYKKGISRLIGIPGEKINDLNLSIIRVRIEDDAYKTRIINGIEYFYVDQLITATDAAGNLFLFTVKATDRSLSSRTLSPDTYAFQTGEHIHIHSAKVLKHIESHHINYTKLGFLKFTIQ